MRVVEIRFRNDKTVELTVEMSDPNRFTTDKAPYIPATLLQLFPQMAEHECENGKGLPFDQECMATELPHLLEHLIIELQGQVRLSPCLRGETHWNWHIDPRGRFRVYLRYENELLVLGAIRLAEQIINAIDRHRIEEIDAEADVHLLEQLASLGEKLNALAKR